MARKAKDAAPPEIGHNLEVVKRDLLSAAVEIVKIDAEIAALQEQKAEIKAAKVKAHGVKLGDFNIVLRWRNLDIENQAETIDNIRLCCEALGVGAQGELFADQEAA